MGGVLSGVSLYHIQIPTYVYIYIYIYIFIFIYGQESPGWISLYKLGTFFLFLKISGDLNLFGKNDWSMNSGRRRAGDC